MSSAGRAGGPRRSAYDHALALLARREHSRKDLALKLECRGHAHADIREALTRLADEGYQSEQRFGEMLVRSRIGQAYGPVRIRAELRSHALDDGLVEALLAEADVQTDWDALARHALQHRYGGRAADDFVDRGKRVQFLLRRGFAAAVARHASQADTDV